MKKVKLKNLEKIFQSKVQDTFNKHELLENKEIEQSEFNNAEISLNKFINQKHIPDNQFNAFWKKNNLKIIDGCGLQTHEIANEKLENLTLRYLIKNAQESLIKNNCIFKLCQNHSGGEKGCKEEKCNQTLEQLQIFSNQYHK